MDGSVSVPSEIAERPLHFDKGSYTVDAVQRAAYRFSDRLSSAVVEEADAIACTLYVAADSDVDAVVADFRNEVLDQVLRERVRAETEGVRNVVLALAFSKTGVTNDET